MRRPAPLPPPADNPGEPEHEEIVVARADAAGIPERQHGADGTGAEHDAQPTVPVELDRPGRTALSDAPASPSSTDAALRPSEVWRAARARRKALRAEIRRFTQRSRRRRIVVWSSVGAVVALILGSVLAAYSPLFAVEKITVVGVKSLRPEVVQQALSGQLGSPLALVDASEVKSALTEFPIIETYALEARPPHELLVRIVERTPIGVVRSAAGYSTVDAAGVVLATTPEKPEGAAELTITGGKDSRAFRSAGQVMRSLSPEVRATVTGVKATSGDDVTLTLQDGRTVIWGSEKDSVLKARVLAQLIKASPDSRTFDVSSPSVPVVR